MIRSSKIYWSLCRPLWWQNRDEQQVIEVLRLAYAEFRRKNAMPLVKELAGTASQLSKWLGESERKGFRFASKKKSEELTLPYRIYWAVLSRTRDAEVATSVFNGLVPSPQQLLVEATLTVLGTNQDSLSVEAYASYMSITGGHDSQETGLNSTAISKAASQCGTRDDAQCADAILATAEELDRAIRARGWA